MSVIDFTTPVTVLENIEACARSGRNMVIGTSGWYAELPGVRKMVEACGIGFLYAANFSVGVNIFFETAKTAAAALGHGYFGPNFRAPSCPQKRRSFGNRDRVGG